MLQRSCWGNSLLSSAVLLFALTLILTSCPTYGHGSGWEVDEEEVDGGEIEWEGVGKPADASPLPLRDKRIWGKQPSSYEVNLHDSSTIDFANFELAQRGAHDVVARTGAPASVQFSEELDENVRMQMLIKLCSVFGRTGLTTLLSCRTTVGGAEVRYRLAAKEHDVRAARLTNSTVEEVPIGFYYIWAERNGVPTSRKELFRVVEREMTIDLVEGRGRRESGG